jgi:aryl-alcohol dehydrogenase-like predicted oxidoreductase
MKKMTLTLSGPEVSSLCLGTMYFGAREDEATSFRLLDQYADAGGSFLDTANIYAHWVPGGKGGESELLLGKWMRERGNRGRMFVATKVGFNYAEQERGLTAEQIALECDKSLKRLGVDTIDLYYAHVDDPDTPLEETLEAFDRLVKAGKVRHIGASNYLAWRLEKARWLSRSNDWAEYLCVQQRYSYVRGRRGVSFQPQLEANDDLVDYCQREGVRLLAYSALLGGAYTRPDREFSAQYIGPDTDNRLAVLRNVANELNVTRNQVVLAWMLATGVLPLIAASTPGQMQENLDVLNIRLSDEQIARLNVAGA